MSKMLVVLSVLLSMNAYSHVIVGKYKGLDQNGKECSFRVEEVYFEDEFAHPLNERLPVTEITFEGKIVDGLIWHLGHPPVVNTALGVNRFNHDIFQQIVATKVGADSVTLLKAEEKEEAAKPVGVIYIQDNYRNKDQSKKMTCLL